MNNEIPMNQWILLTSLTNAQLDWLIEAPVKCQWSWNSLDKQIVKVTALQK